MAATQSAYGVVSIPAQAQENEDDRVYVRLRADLDIGAFGANVVVRKTKGEPVIGEHDELGPGAGGHEELYVVVDGHATFTVEGEDIDAPRGTAVFVRDPAAKRKAVAVGDGTVVIAVGGPRGEAYRVPPGGMLSEFFRLHRAKDYEGALAVCREVLDEYPGNALVFYNIACCESLLGRTDDALATLRTAVEAWPDYAGYARDDEDFASIRDDARFKELVG